MPATIQQESYNHNYISSHRLPSRRDPWANRDRKSVDNDVLQLEEEEEKPAAERHVHGEKVCYTDNGEIEKKPKLGPPTHHNPRTFRERGVQVISVRDARNGRKILVKSVE